MWTWVTRSSPLKDRTITDLVFMQTYSNHGALHCHTAFYWLCSMSIRMMHQVSKYGRSLTWVELGRSVTQCCPGGTPDISWDNCMFVIRRLIYLGIKWQCVENPWNVTAALQNLHWLVSLFEISYSKYSQVSNIRRTKSQHLKDSRTVLRLSLPNPLKPYAKSRMKM